MRTARILTVLTFALFTAFAMNSFAADPQPGTNTKSATFIDENGDGICDNYAANGGKGLGLGKGERRNISNAENSGKGLGLGKNGRRNFIDTDGDGVCDNYTNNNGKGLYNGKGALGNFVDADGDGICDNGGTSKTVKNTGAKVKTVNSLKK